jgi:hypothetical protein
VCPRLMSCRSLVNTGTLVAVLIVAVSVHTRAYAAQDAPAAVVLIGDLSPAGVIEAASDQVPARWRFERIWPESPSPLAPLPDVSTLARAYVEADFLQCLTELQRASLDLDKLIERGRRTEAARVGTYAAACALGAGDAVRARELMRRLLVHDLDDPDTLRRTTPQFQALAEEERRAAQKWGRVAVEVYTEPAGASVQVDGIVRCAVSPCRVHMLRGEHLVMAEKLGRRPRALTASFEEDQTLTVALDLAAADEVRRQLTVTLGSGIDPSGIDVARAAASAFGVGTLALVWQRDGRVHTIAFQRGASALTHVAIDAGSEAVPRSVRSALHEWLSDVGAPPRPMLRQPLFWTTAVGVALLSAAAVFMISRPMETRHDIVFQ